MYGIFSPQNVRGRGVSLVREGQNSLWADGFLCLLGNAQGMCLGGDGCSFSCVIRFLDGEHRFRNPKQKKARLTDSTESLWLCRKRAWQPYCRTDCPSCFPAWVGHCCSTVPTELSLQKDGGASMSPRPVWTSGSLLVCSWGFWRDWNAEQGSRTFPRNLVLFPTLLSHHWQIQGFRFMVTEHRSVASKYHLGHQVIKRNVFW